jgi:type I restriction enzyme S subunit
MSSDDFTRQVTAVSAQTDMAPYVSLQDQRKMVIQLPPSAVQQEMAKLLEPIDARIASNAEQSRTLASLRGTLLPKLLSGELSVTESLEHMTDEHSHPIASAVEARPQSKDLRVS